MKILIFIALLAISARADGDNNLLQSRRMFGFEKIQEGLQTLKDNLDKNFDLNIIDKIIQMQISDVTSKIKKAKLDPYYYPGFNYKFSVPEVGLLNIDAKVDNITVRGASNVVQQTVTYNMLAEEVTVDIYIPRLELALGHGSFDGTFFGQDVPVRANFNIAILKPRVNGTIKVKIGMNGPKVTSVNLHFTIERVKIDGYFKVGKFDLLANIEDKLNYLINWVFSETQDFIDELTDIITWAILPSPLIDLGTD